MKYKESQKRPARFLSMTGYTIGNFEPLYSRFEETRNTRLPAYRMTVHGLRTVPDMALELAETVPARINEKFQEVSGTNPVLLCTVSESKISRDSMNLINIISNEL
jgi:hypothetical protein